MVKFTYKIHIGGVYVKCTNCGFEQQEGKFCGQCGAPLSVGDQEAVKVDATNESTSQGYGEQAAGAEASQSAPVSDVKDNEALDKVKQVTKTYGTYYVKYLKRPSRIFSEKVDFKHGLISMTIIVILMALSVALLIRNFMQPYEGFAGMFSDSSYNVGPSFFAMFGYAMVFLVICMAIIVFLIYVVNQFFGTAYTFKEMSSVYGAHLVPAITVTGVAFILILLKSNTFGSYLLFTGFGLVVWLFPLYLISSLLSRRTRNIDPLYGYLIYIVLTAIAFIIFALILVDSTFGRVLDQIGYY